MSEQSPQTTALFEAFREAMEEDKDNTTPKARAAILAGLVLVEQVVSDLHRSADALERLASNNEHALNHKLRGG